jgi:hypothetical protein
MIWRDHFERLASNGEHYTCKYCHDIFSDVSTMPEFIKALMFLMHIKRDHPEKWTS